MTAKGYERFGSLALVLLAALLMLCGCSGKGTAEAPQEEMEGEQEEQEQEAAEDTQLYMLLYSNSDTGKIFVQSVDSGRQEEFDYNGGTYIRNRYGDSITMGQLQTGELIRLAYNGEKLLTEIKVDSDAFIYDSVSNFSVRSQENIITVGDSKYSYDGDLKVFSENIIISLNELGERDTICVRGMGRQILSIVVERGHGTVILKNTELYEGGMVTIGNVAAQKITQSMSLEVPEGTWKLSVANDGYGGTQEITVVRFQELEVDLNALGGERAQYGKVSFVLTPENAVLKVNGEVVDTSKPKELRYGVYTLSLTADGFDGWSGNLVVCSAEATIELDLEGADSDTDTGSTETDSESSADAGSGAGTGDGSGSSADAGSGT